MSDVYAEFGVNSAVMSSSDPTEHEQNMLALDVRTRDGDAEITLAKTKEDEEEEKTSEKTKEDSQEENPEENPEGNGEESPNADPEDQANEEGEEDDLTTLGEPDAELKAASDEITQYTEGFETLKEQAIKAGMTQEQITKAEQEYERDGKLSEASYEAMLKAGYSKGFIDSYIKGQEAVAERFVQKVVEYAGGQEKFQRIISHMQAASPESVESLYEAVERQDLKAIRSIINLGIQSRTKKLGKAPERQIQQKAPSVAPTPKPAAKAKGYASRSEMIKDMSSDAYRHDPVFRAKVEQRVAASDF